MAVKIFFFAFAVSLLLQGIRIWQIPTVDTNLWAAESMYVQNDDQSQFYIWTASAHPGGPIIEGTIATHTLVGTSYKASLKIFLDFAESIVIAFVCVLCYALKKSHAWWVLVLITLSLDRMYDYATPPSALVAVLSVLLLLLTWYVYEIKQRENLLLLAAWAAAAGITVSSRADAGSVLVCAFGLFLLISRTVSPVKMLWMALGAIAAFALTDPYLWLLGVQHLVYIISVSLSLYAQPAPAYFLHLTVPGILIFSLTSFISIAVGTALIFSRNKTSPVPQALFVTVLCATSILYIVLLTAQLQTPRFFMPLVFIWETLLPVYVFSIIPATSFGVTGNAQVRLHRNLRYGFSAAVAAYPIILFILSLWIYYLSYSAH